MFKQQVTYTDFNGNTQTDTLYFNVTKSELMDHLDLAGKVENIQNLFAGEERDLTVPEIQMVLDLVKTLIKMSYGIRSEDGKRFKKSDDIWEDFTQSAVYDAFLFSLFEEPSKAAGFMTGVMPSDLIDQAKRQIDPNQPTLPDASSEEKSSLKRPRDISKLSKKELMELVEAQKKE